MAFQIVPLDVIEISRRLERVVVPVQISQPLVNCWISATDISDVAFEVLHVYRIEPNNCNEESDIRLSQLFAEIIWPILRSEMEFGTVEVDEKGIHGFLVCDLRSRKVELVSHG